MTLQDWEAVRGVVLDGAFYATRAVINSMAENNYGRILFFNRRRGLSGRRGSGPTYPPPRWAWWGWPAAWPLEFAGNNVRVNVVSPGSIDTSRANPEWYNNRPPNAAGIPLGRQGHVDEIAATCLFLVSDDSGFITGQTIHVNGGVAFH